MKKVLFMFAAVAALTFTACGNSSKGGAETDSVSDTTAVTDSSAAAVAPEDANALTGQLSKLVEAKDANAVAKLLESAKQKAAEMAKNNPEQAKAYVSALQTWVNNNAAAIKAAVANAGNTTVANAVSTAVGAVSTINPDDVVKSIAASAESDAQAAGSKLLESAKAGAAEAVENSKVGEAAEKAAETKKAIDEAPQKAADAVNKKVSEAQEKANKKANEAVNKANKKVNDAVNNATNKALKGLGL